MTSFVAVMIVKATIVLILGCAIAFAARKTNASVRHGIWALTLAAALGLPLGMIAAPAWRVALLPASTSITNQAVPAALSNAVVSSPAVIESAPSVPFEVSETSVASRSISFASVVSRIPELLPPLWVAGALAIILWMAAGLITLKRIARRAKRLDAHEWRQLLFEECGRADVLRQVDLLSSESVSTPLTWGIWNPVIVLPVECSTWSEEHRAVVLRHELAHIARADTLTQTLGAIACALYWFNPLVWIAARALRAEQERACDEKVLVSGTPAVEYAAHLLEVARSARALGPQGFVSLAMARPSQLEGRLLAVLNSRNNHGGLSPAIKGLAITGATLGFVAVSAFTPISRAALLPRAVVPSIIASQFVPSASPIATAKGAWTSVASKIARDSSIAKSVDVSDGGTLELDLKTGASLTITGWNEPRVEVTGTLGGRDWRDTEVRLERTSTGARLYTNHRDMYGSSTNHHFDIRVPKRYNIRVSSAGGGITISGLEGSFSGNTGGGTLSIDRAHGRASLTTGGGSIKVSNSNLSGSVSTGGGTVVIQDVTGGLRGHSGSTSAVYINSDGDTGTRTSSRTSVSNSTSGGKTVTSVMSDANDAYDAYDGYDGGVTISGRGSNVTINERTGEIRDPSGRVIYRKSGGSVSVGEAMSGADIRTGGGSVTVGRSAGDVIARTGGGDITIGPLAGSAKASTGAGDVRLDFSGVRSPGASVSSGNGRVDVTLPADFNGTLDLETAYTDNLGHRTTIKSDWPLSINETSEWDDRNGTPRRYVRARQIIGRGGSVISVRTVNGDVVIQRGR